MNTAFTYIEHVFLRMLRRFCLTFFAVVLVSSCGGGGGGGSEGSGSGVASSPLYVSIEDPSIFWNDSADSVDLYGTASCDACPPAVAGCPQEPPLSSAIQMAWRNRTTGSGGPVSHAIYGTCGCLFSACWTNYSHKWGAIIPLAIGSNDIEVRASNASGETGRESITVTRLPPPLPVVTGLVAASGKGQVTLNWAPVAGATFYNLYWATSRNVRPDNATKISGVSSPFTHAGLSNDVTIYYIVSAAVGAVESEPSSVAWATPGWLIADVAVAPPTTGERDTSIATDSMGGAHIHYSLNETSTNSRYNYYATNVPLPWAPLLVARPRWVSSGIALETDGTVHVVYLGFGGLKHAVNTSGTWTEELTDVTGKCEASLAVDSAGKVHVAYYSSAGGKTLRYATNASGSWVSSNIETFASLGCSFRPDHTVSLGVDATGVAHIAYAGGSPDYGLKYATNGGGTWSISTLDSHAIEHVSLAVDLNAKVHITYDNNGYQLKYAHGVTGAWTIEVLEETNFVWSRPVLALDAAGKAHVSYIVSLRPGSELTYATNASGSWQASAIDNSASAAAIAVDPLGGVQISYIRDGKIKYATNK
jgi:hypothetical protein